MLLKRLGQSTKENTSSLCELGAFSFHATIHLFGEGGALTINDPGFIRARAVFMGKR